MSYIIKYFKKLTYFQKNNMIISFNALENRVKNSKKTHPAFLIR